MNEKLSRLVDKFYNGEYNREWPEVNTLANMRHHAEAGRYRLYWEDAHQKVRSLFFSPFFHNLRYVIFRHIFMFVSCDPLGILAPLTYRAPEANVAAPGISRPSTNLKNRSPTSQPPNLTQRTNCPGSPVRGCYLHRAFPRPAALLFQRVRAQTQSTRSGEEQRRAQFSQLPAAASFGGQEETGLEGA